MHPHIDHVTHAMKKAIESVAERAAQVAEHGHEHEHIPTHSHGTELHTFIGVSLVLGFVFMLLVDQLSGGSTHMHAPGAGKYKEKQDLLLLKVISFAPC